MRTGQTDRAIEAAIAAEARSAGIVLDDAQNVAASRLARLAGPIGDPDERPVGVYLHGPAGRGKTWLADAFLRAVPDARTRRVHFHGFLEELHRAIFARRIDAAPAQVDAVAGAIDDTIGDAEVLVFDEFHVHDPGDARLLTLLLHRVADRGIAVVATSNYAPAQLLPSPIWHHLFEPGIALIEERFDIVPLEGPRDYREGGKADGGFAAGRWIVADATPGEPTVRVVVRGRSFDVVGAGGGELTITFAQLCEAPTSAIEYLDWATRYPRWTVRDVPSLAAVPPPARQRFVNAIDVLVDRGVPATFTSVLTLEAFIASAHDAGPDAPRLTSRLRLLRAEEATASTAVAR